MVPTGADPSVIVLRAALTGFICIFGILYGVCHIGKKRKVKHVVAEEQFFHKDAVILESQNQNKQMRILLDKTCDEYQELKKHNAALRDKINFYKAELKILQTQLIKYMDDNLKMRDLIFEGE
jgi:hypothetical protein